MHLNFIVKFYDDPLSLVRMNLILILNLTLSEVFKLLLSGNIQLHDTDQYVVNLVVSPWWSLIWSHSAANFALR